MLHTTFAKVKKANACISSYKQFAKFKGGIRKWGNDNPFPISEVLEVCGLQDAIWCLRCTIEPSANLTIEFACRCAEHILHIYEDEYPNDKRPRRAIETARLCITDKSAAAWAAARDAGAAVWAAWAAARDAGAAVWAAWAAGAAARDAEIEWQKQTLLNLLKETNCPIGLDRIHCQSCYFLVETLEEGKCAYAEKIKTAT